MKMLEKIKSLAPKLTSRKGKIVGFSMLILGTVAAATMTTLAWFNLSAKESTIKMVSGDLNVEVRKVSAYKYVYPFYKNSTEFVDYDAQGIVKKYILEDHILTYNDTDVDDIAINSDNATVTLGERFGGSTTDYYTVNQNNASSSLVCIPEVDPPAVYRPEFRYYLIGDNLFSGVDNSWSLTDGYAFAKKDTVTAQEPAVLDNIVVSAGSSFRLLEVIVDNTTYSYNYYPLSSIAESASSFRIVSDDGDQVGDKLLCLRSGIYKFSISPNQLKIELRTRDAGARKDISVITNNSFDPTKVSIDYAGSVSHTTYPTINSYVPTAIYEQNTMLILDVELNFTNANPIDVALQIKRTDISDATYGTYNSVFNLPNKYADTSYNLDGYISVSQQNLMRASDFYNYYAQFTKTPYADSAAVWNGLHRVGDAQCQKFSNTIVENNTPKYDDYVDCTMHTKEQNDSLIVPAAALNIDNIYHCYICIEYDYEHSTYFLNKNRLGKTYLLDRDFGFYFSGIQHKEAQSQR